MILNKEQEKLVVQAGQLLKEAFPGRNFKFNFNFSQKHDGVNYNMEGEWKVSGIIPAKK